MRRALGPQVRGEGDWAGPGERWAGPGEQGRGLAAQKPAGGAGRHVREEGARCLGWPGTRGPGFSRACLPAHVCIIFEMECGIGARGAARVGGGTR